MATRIIPEKITLPSDPAGWVEFYDPRDLTGRDHQKAMESVKDGESQVAMAMGVLYSLAEALVKSWHIPYTPKGSGYEAGQVPIPEHAPGVLASLRMDDYSAIIGIAAPVASLLNGGGGVNVDDADTPGSPTVPSGG
jgi:hypothetical protein